MYAELGFEVVIFNSKRGLLLVRLQGRADQERLQYADLKCANILSAIECIEGSFSELKRSLPKTAWRTLF